MAGECGGRGGECGWEWAGRVVVSAWAGGWAAEGVGGSEGGVVFLHGEGRLPSYCDSCRALRVLQLPLPQMYADLKQTWDAIEEMGRWPFNDGMKLASTDSPCEWMAVRGPWGVCLRCVLQVLRASPPHSLPLHVAHF